MAAIGAWPFVAAAQTVGTTTSGSFPLTLNNGQVFVGQVVQPFSDSIGLQSYTLDIARVSGTLTVTPQVYEIVVNGANTTVTPTPVWSGSNVAVTNLSPSRATFTFVPNVGVDPAKLYAVGVRRATAGQDGRVYVAVASDYLPGGVLLNNGSSFSFFNGEDLGFTATFQAAPTIPTLTEWGIILLAFGLAAAAVTLVKKPRAA